jgi:hypothetical protein
VFYEANRFASVLPILMRIMAPLLPLASAIISDVTAWPHGKGANSLVQFH